MVRPGITMEGRGRAYRRGIAMAWMQSVMLVPMTKRSNASDFPNQMGCLGGFWKERRVWAAVLGLTTAREEEGEEGGVRFDEGFYRGWGV